MNSRVTLTSASLFTVGTIAWYTHLYGTLPFIGEVHASSLSDEGLHPPKYPWSHSGWLDSFDHARCNRPASLSLVFFSLTRVCAAFGEVTKFTAKSVLRAILWIALHGVTSLACRIPLMNHAPWPRSLSTLMDQMLRATCFNDLENWRTTCRSLIQTRRPLVLATVEPFHLISA